MNLRLVRTVNNVRVCRENLLSFKRLRLHVKSKQLSLPFVGT